MDYAAENGHLDVVKWLHQNRQEGYTKDAMDNAARNGHLEVVKWLHENLPEGPLKCSLWCAASCGQMVVVKWLVEHLNPEYVDIASALEVAGKARQWKVMEFLLGTISSSSNG